MYLYVILTLTFKYKTEIEMSKIENLLSHKHVLNAYWIDILPIISYIVNPWFLKPLAALTTVEATLKA